VAEALDLENSLLVMQFRQFCAELLHLRDQLERPPVASPAFVVAEPKVAEPSSPTAAAYAAAAAATAAAVAAARSAGAVIDDPEPPPVIPSAGSTWPAVEDLLAAQREEGRNRLLNLLEQQTYQSMALGGAYGITVLREAQYVMTALADEVLLTANWPGKTGWRLLEEEIFHSHASGEIFFTRLDALLKQGDAGSAELAMVFFLALAMNFRGKYRNNDPHKVLSRYRRQLFLRLYHRAPESAADGVLFAQAYDVAPSAEEYRPLPNPHRWWFAVAGVLVAWLLISWAIWASLISPLHEQLQRIQHAAGMDSGATLP
jgi:type VI secretion system protein ImpK